MSPDSKVAAVAAKQYGAVTHEQARRSGLSDGAIRYRRESGRWLSPHRGVYVIAGTVPTREQAIIVAVLALGRTASASHTDAAALFLWIPPTFSDVHVTVPHGLRKESRKGIAPHQADLTRADVRMVRGIRTTCPNRTLVDLAGVIAPRRLEACVDEAILTSLTTATRAWSYIEDRSLRHKKGVGTLIALLADRTAGALQKELERMFLRKLRRSGLPMTTRQHPEGRRKIDFAYPDVKIAIELDGRNPHSSGAVFRDDRRRQNELVLAGWYPLRFTWTDVEDDWPLVEATLRTLREQRGRVG